MDRPVLATRRAVVLGAAAWMSGLEAQAASLPFQSLFVIARSKNANEVHYDVRVRSDGRLDPDEPVTAYWIMRAEDGRREGLSFLERRFAYGFGAKFSARGDALSLRLQAFPARVLGVRSDARGRFRAHVPIAGHAARLDRIFVATDEGGVTPRVRYLELFGVSQGGTSVTERIQA
jgi:hypothetical protein